jgi:hypothetical protein
MASPSNTPRIVELAAQISSSVTELQERLSARGIPSPSFAEDSPQDFPADLESLRDGVVDATAELHELLLDPLQLLYKFAAVWIFLVLQRRYSHQLIPPDPQHGRY